MYPEGSINHSVPELNLVQPLSDSQFLIKDPNCSTLQAYWIPSESPSDLGRTSSITRQIVKKIQEIMKEFDCIWWLTNGGPFQLARGDNMTDPDFDVAYTCRANSTLPYYECQPGRFRCGSIHTYHSSMRTRIMELFPGHEVILRKNAVIVVKAPASMTPAEKIIDFVPVFVMDGSPTHMHTGGAKHRSLCPKEYGVAGWPCTRWNITTIFPLQRCLIEGMVVPCPADIATYSQLDNHAEYINEGNAQCHGCSSCLLWGNDRPGSKALVHEKIVAMEKLDRCGFGTLLSLVPTLVEKNNSIYCGCGVMSGKSC